MEDFLNELERKASHNLERNEPLIMEPPPALIRRASAAPCMLHPVKVKIDLFRKASAGPAEPAQHVIIDTGEEEPRFNFCAKKLPCGHSCKGVADERKCLPCLEAGCVEKSGLAGGVGVDEYCTICYTTTLGEEPCSKLNCRHVYHTRCVVELLEHKWSTLRIGFGFMSCPGCKTEIDPRGLSRPIIETLAPLLSLKHRVEQGCLENAAQQGILKDDRVAKKGEDYYGRELEYAMHRCSYYECNACKLPYFGGLIDCEQDMANVEENKTQKEDLNCQDCILKEIGAGTTKCDKHGKEQIDWKCQFCCSVALYCCFGTHYFCYPCHEEYNRTLKPPLVDCHGIDCPLGIAHPPPNADPRKGGVFPLGCGICRSEKLDAVKAGAIKQQGAAVKYWNKWDAEKQAKGNKDIIRPDIEIEVPEWFAQADEILEAEEAVEAERIRILNKTPVKIYPPSYYIKQAKKARQAERALLRGDIIPQWFLAEDAEEEQEEKKEEAQPEVAQPEAAPQPEEEEVGQAAAAAAEAVDDRAQAKKKTLEVQKKAARVIASLQPKRARANRRRK